MATRKYYKTLSRPGFVIDQESVALHQGRQVDWDSVAADETGRKVLPAGTVVVELPNGSVAPRNSADAISETTTAGASAETTEGDVVITLAGHSLNAGDTIDISNADDTAIDGEYVIIATTEDTVTISEADATDGASTLDVTFGVPSGLTAFGILVDSAHQVSRSDALTGYGVFAGGGFYENYLPDFSSPVWATIKGEFNDRFYFETLENSILD